jgi:hypothetical protein
MTDLPGTQLIRLVDVFLLGPAMIYAAAKVKRHSESIALLLFVSGLSTVAFNGINFMRRRAESA